MKIALIILHADSARGGAERYTLDLAQALVKRGHDVWILASSFQNDFIAGQRVSLAAGGMTRTGRYNAFLNSLDQELITGQYDIAHAMLPVRRCDLYHPHAGVAAEATARGHLTKSGLVGQLTAWVGNQFNFRRRRFAAVERRLLLSKQPPSVICLSKLIQAVVLRHYPTLPEKKQVLLFNGIDLNRFDPAVDRSARQRVRAQFQIDDTTVVGLLLAQDFERKGVGPAIRALAQLPQSKLLLLIGGKPDPSDYRKLAKALGVQHQVIFTGPVTNPAAFFQAADFFLLPTRFDPCSLVVLEALAMDLPVISTLKNGACEIMQDGIHGRVLADADNLKALAEAMMSMTDTDARHQMTIRVRELRSQLSQEHHVNRLESIYRSIHHAKLSGNMTAANYPFAEKMGD